MMRTLCLCKTSILGSLARRSLSTSRLAGTPGNDYNYYDVVADFKWNLPKTFNFAKDVVDQHATDLPKGLAFHHVSEDGKAETKWTFAELSLKSKEVAAAMNTLGSIKRAVTVLPKVPEWWLVNLSAMRTGTILLPGTTLLTASDIANRIVKSEADCIIGDVDVATKVEAETHPAHLKHKILVSTGDRVDEQARLVSSCGWIPLSELVSQNASQAANLAPVETKSSDIMQIFFTSGTTGAPKMVPHTQGSYGYCHWVTGKYWLDLTPSDLHWNIADTGWAKSAWSSVLAPWSQGAGVFVHAMKRFTSEDVFRTLAEHPITTLCAPPTLYRSMVKEAEGTPGAYKFHSLRHCLSAGEPLNEEVVHEFEENTGIIIKEGYGQTETTLLAANFKGMEVRPGSMGKSAPGVDIRIVNNMGVEVERGEMGNIGVYCRPHRPPGLFTGYLGAESKVDHNFVGDYYVTGDRAIMDNDGYIWFTSRDDDIIISAGYRIGPFEVESALLEHPSVAESAVVASPDVLRGQIVKAFVVPTEQYANKLRDDSSEAKRLTEELQDFVRQKTAPYKYPRSVKFVESLPKTVSGKIKRAVLRKNEMKRVTKGAN